MADHVTRLWLMVILSAVSVLLQELPFLASPKIQTVNVHVEKKGAGAESRDRRAAEQPDVRALPATLEVRLSLANQDLSLILEKNSNVDVRPPVFVARNGALRRVDVPQAKADVGFYQDPDTGASFSVRLRHDGSGYLLSGTYFSGGVQYLLTPNFNSSEIGSRTGDHDVMRLSSVIHLQNDFVDLLPGADHTLKLQASEATAFCTGVYGDLADVTKDSVDVIATYDFFGNRPATAAASAEFSDVSGHVRRRRQVTPQGAFAVELLMVVDYGVYEKWLSRMQGTTEEARKQAAIENITEYYSFVLNGVDLRYAGINANFSIDVTFAGILVFDDPLDTYWSGGRMAVGSSRDLVEASDALEAFRGWALKLGASLPPSDHVMLFTGFNLTYGGSVSNAGLAYLGSACNTDYFFSIVEEYLDFRTVAVAAHELAHSLGARHDMDGNTCLTFDRYIMTSRFRFPTARTAQNPWKFSSCSVQYFSAFIDDLVRNDTNCLVTKDAITTNMEIQPFLASLPGQVYPGDQFCQLSEGAGSYICRAQHATGYDTTCYAGLQCYRPEFQDCDLKLPPDGLACGNKKWCENGTCIFSPLAPTAVDDLCPFGDDPVLLTAGSNCSERVTVSRGDCYDQSFRARCCQSCAAARRHLPGCEFGDRSDTCDGLMCAAYDPTYLRHNCCDTCSDVLLSTTASASSTHFTSGLPASTASSPTVYSALASSTNFTLIHSPPDSATGTLIAHSPRDSATGIPIAHSPLDSTTDTPIANRLTDSTTDTHPEVPTVSERAEEGVDLTSTHTALTVRSSHFQETPTHPPDYSPSVDRALTPPLSTDQPPVIHKAFSPPAVFTDLPPATPGSQRSPAAPTAQTLDIKIKAQTPAESTDRPPAILKAFTYPQILTVQSPVQGVNTPQIPTDQAPVIHRTFAPPPVFTDQPRVIHKTFSYPPVLTDQTPVIQKAQPSSAPTDHPVSQRADTRPPISADQTPVNQRTATPPVSTDHPPLTHGRITSFSPSDRPLRVTDSSASLTDISSQETTSAITFTLFRKTTKGMATNSVDSSSSESSWSFAFTTNLDKGTPEKHKSRGMTTPTSMTDSAGLTSSPDRTARVTSFGDPTSQFGLISARELTSHGTNPQTSQGSTFVISSTSRPTVGSALGLTTPEPLRSAAELTLTPPVTNLVTGEQSEAGATSPTGLLSASGSTSPAGTQHTLSLKPVSVVMSVPGVTSAPGLTSTQRVTSLLGLMPSTDMPHRLVTNIKQTSAATTATNNIFHLTTPSVSKNNFSFAKVGTVNPNVTSRGGKKTRDEEQVNKTRDEGRKSAGRGTAGSPVPKPRGEPPLPSSPASPRGGERPRGGARDRRKKYDEEKEESVSKESEAGGETTDERGGGRVGSSSEELGQQLQKVRKAFRNKAGSKLTREQRLILLVNLVTLLQQGLTTRDLQPAAHDITRLFGNDFGNSNADPRTTRLTAGVKGSDPISESHDQGQDLEGVGLQQQGVSRESAPSELPLHRSGPTASRQAHPSAARRIGYREPGGSSRRRRSPKSADILTFHRHRPLIQALWKELTWNSGRHRREGASSETAAGDIHPADTAEHGFSARPRHLPQKPSLQPNLERHGFEPTKEVTEALYNYDDHVEEEDEGSEDLDDDIPEHDPFWQNDTVSFNDGFDRVVGVEDGHEETVVSNEGSDARDESNVDSHALSDVIVGPSRNLTSLNSAEKSDAETRDKPHDVGKKGDNDGTDDSTAADDRAYESSDVNDDGSQATSYGQVSDVEEESRDPSEGHNYEHCEKDYRSDVSEPGDKDGEDSNDNIMPLSHDGDDRNSENRSDFAESSAKGERDETASNNTSATSAHAASHRVTNQIHQIAPPGDHNSYLEEVESAPNLDGEDEKTPDYPIVNIDHASSEVADNDMTQTPAADPSVVADLQAALVTGDRDLPDHDVSSVRRSGNSNSDFLVKEGNASRNRGSSLDAVDLDNDDDEDSVRFVESGDDTNAQHNRSTTMNDVTTRIDDVTKGVGDITTGVVVVMTGIGDAVSQSDRKIESGLAEKTPQVEAITLHSGSKLNESAAPFLAGDSRSAERNHSMARSDKMAESGGAERLTNRDLDTEATDRGITGRRRTTDGSSVMSVTAGHVDTVLGRNRMSDQVVSRETPGASQRRSTGHKRVSEEASTLGRQRQHRGEVAGSLHHRATPPSRRLSGQPVRVSKVAYSVPRGQLILPEAMSGAWVTSGTSMKNEASTTDGNSSAIYLPTSTTSISPRVPRVTFDPGHTTVERKTSTNHRTSVSTGRRVGPKKSIRSR